jgi:predicted kinase
MGEPAIQLGLTYRPSYAGHEAWQLQLEALRSAVTHLVPKEVCDQLDISKSQLSQALHEQADKRMAAEWIHVIKAMLAQRYDDVSQELLRTLCNLDMTVTAFEIGDPKGLTPEQERDAYRAELARLGDEGKAAISRVLKKGKR